MSEESLNPERDGLWEKHDGLTPACCAEMIALAGKLEQERNEARRIAKEACTILSIDGYAVTYPPMPWEEDAETTPNNR